MRGHRAGQIQSPDHLVRAWLLRCRCARPGRSAACESLPCVAIVRRWTSRTRSHRRAMARTSSPRNANAIVTSTSAGDRNRGEGITWPTPARVIAASPKESCVARPAGDQSDGRAGSRGVIMLVAAGIAGSATRAAITGMAAVRGTVRERGARGLTSWSAGRAAPTGSCAARSATLGSERSPNVPSRHRKRTPRMPKRSGPTRGAR